MSKPFKVPFTKKDQYYGGPAGSMLGYAYVGHPEYQDTEDIEWREPQEFCAKLYVEGASRGRSAVEFKLTDEAGHHYVMRLKEFVNMVKESDLHYGWVNARWGYKKQGANWGLTYLGGAFK